MSGDTSSSNNGGWMEVLLAKAAWDKDPWQSILWPKYRRGESWGVLLIGTQAHNIKGILCHPGTLPSSRPHQLCPRSTVYYLSSTANRVLICRHVCTMGNCLSFLWQRKTSRGCTESRWGRLRRGQVTGTTLTLLDLANRLTRVIG